ncbi:hypothetical protein AALP_AA2G213000 [Arabis alpina]|uniref:DUF506 family protein n=1 Tax=Arabis alpina TaxID=50452 RepID=A0A087HJ15_ARAAL|nr:hypothetical protein AALP_AA2G213000 [Arabis alpina]
MGSLGEEDLEMLVLDYIESPVTFSDHKEKSSRSLITLQEILGTRREEEMEIEGKIISFMERRRLSYEGDDEKKDVMKKIVSKLKSDGYNAFISKTSWDSSFDQLEGCRVFRCTRKYEYIDVMSTTDDARKVKRVIIDLDFKSQFELVNQTKDYKDITEMLPKVLVVSEERLKRVVSLVCGEMKKSMKEEGMCRPPWRTTRYMQAKWLLGNRSRRGFCTKRESWPVFDVDDGEVETMSGGGGNGSKTTCCLPIF